MKKILVLFGLLFMMSKMTFAQGSEDRITLDLKDTPVRTTLEMVFNQAGIKNYVIDNEVAGFVTMTITNQPFENSLKLIMRAATLPLTYIKENDVYIVKVRKITEFKSAPVPDVTQQITTNNIVFERISLTFIDPLDLMGAFGNILYIRQFNRSMMGGMGGMGSGLGGGMGMGGSMGGMGGGMSGGMGGMSGGMGGMGGLGMGGGLGGFGGGRNF